MNVLAPLALALAVAQAPAAPAPAAPAAGAPEAAASTLTLDDALRLAAERNHDLRAAAARLRQAEQGYWKVLAGHLPQVTAGASYTRNGEAVSLPFPVALTTPPTPAAGAPEGQELVSVLVDVVPKTQLQWTLDATQVLFAPSLWFAIQAASRGEDVARAQVENARRAIVFGAAQAFYGVAARRRFVEVQERLLEIQQRQEKDARVRHQAGTIAKVALLRAEIERAKAEQDLLRARNAYQAARLALATLLDRPADFEVADPEEPRPPADAAQLVEAALRDRADVRAARSAVEAATAARRAQYAGYLPSVAAFGHYQNADVAGLTGQELWTVGLSARWSVFDGGLREANVREASARVAEAQASLASAEARARLEVSQALLELESARANATKAREQRELATENQRLVDVAFRAGSATAVEQADATAQLRTAETAQTTEALAAQLAALRVLEAAGASLR